ncbi:hypothetical protein B0H15DRAFT_470405 [Mycena belliarum]|uniref:Fungal-type protein kinase domain-containing protein n=1 Tax=Mycena belliarum TaxID=1033014 RepID=A0AAD6TY09_9AGAR|nr:hypothetical protein B0H15DRAFT_470405 [Mycena belliae]
MVWDEILASQFAGNIPISEFLESYLPKPRSEHGAFIDSLVSDCASLLEDVKAEVKDATNERLIADPLIKYLHAVASCLPQETRPRFDDTQNKPFPPADPDPEDHCTRPDVTATRPGKAVPDCWKWPHAGTIINLKHKLDVFDINDAIADNDESRDALVQLAESARSLLIGTDSCFVFVISIFANTRARIFRFDRVGFRASHAFSWTDEPKILPTFFHRLYNPDDRPGRMYGEDDTISSPTDDEKQQMYEVLCRNEIYKRLYPTKAEATTTSLWIQAIRFSDDDERKPTVVRCFTIGHIISFSDGLFSRATRVYRVILKEDADSDNPPVYALKDAWRQGCRRPEVDYYDVIARHCKEKDIDMDAQGLARCHGSVDLSDLTDIDNAMWDPTSHRTRSTHSNDDSFERFHMRSLLTPVGRALESFKSTYSLVQALHTAILHHRIAYDAGILHRDVSEGNVLFDELMDKAFLLDWDYAEFTEGGLKNFNTWFSERADANKKYEDIDKSLKGLTGTFPFLAMEIATPNSTTIHGPHHDLESFYWLLVWMTVRHTDHTHPCGKLACSKIFDDADLRYKCLQVFSPVATDTPLFLLLESLRNMVVRQNPPAPARDIFGDEPDEPSAAVPMTYNKMLQRFDSAAKLPDWPKRSKAHPYRIPSKAAEARSRASARKADTQNSLHKQAEEYNGSQKRARQEDGSEKVGTATAEPGPKRQKTSDSDVPPASIKKLLRRNP